MRITLSLSLTLVAGLFVVLGPLGLRAQSYHPLEIGSEWYYEDETGGSETRTITGERDILGVTAAVREDVIMEGGEIVGLFENFWTCDDDGSLFLHGAINYLQGIEFAYMPPLEVVDSPLYLGKTWMVQGFLWCNLDGTDCSGPADLHLEVFTEGEAAVPAGDFYAYGVGHWLMPPELVGPEQIPLDLLGRAAPGSRRGRDPYLDWYSEDVGVIQFQHLTDPSELVRLVSWDVTPVDSQSWGTIKALFK